jgi:arylsulfatase A-like enzyme
MLDGWLAPSSAPPFAARARRAGADGFGAGVVAGVVLALGEVWAIARQPLGSEAQVLWYGPLAYAALFGAAGALGGALLAVLPLDERESRGWTSALALLLTLVPVGLAISVIHLQRAVSPEQTPPLPVLGAFGGLALLLLFAGPRLFRGAAGKLFTPPLAIALLILVAGGGWIAAGRLSRAATPGTPAPAGGALAHKPNVVLVMVDALRADRLSCYGGNAPTPNLCRIARDGGTIYSGFSHASWTRPATASLLTSLVPSSHQTMVKAAVLPSNVDTLAEAFQRAGYATGAFVSGMDLSAGFGFAQGFGEYHELGPDYAFGARESSSKLALHQIFRRAHSSLAPSIRVSDFYQDSAALNRHAFAFLDRHGASRFFLFLHYMDPHDPYFEHPYNGRGVDRTTNPHPPASEAQRMRELYVGEIAYLDDHFGRLIAKLEALGLYDESVIALVADHGEEFQEHGGYWHGLTLYDEQIHVPLLVKWSKSAPAAPPDARGEPARLIDVAPTLLARAGVAVPPAMQGVDLAVLPEARAPGDRIVFAEESHGGNVLRAVRTGRWKWIEANAGNPRGLPKQALFEVELDPGEQVNVVEREPGTAAELARQASDYEARAKAGIVGSAVAAQVSPEECAQLKQLGYVEDCGGVE